MSLSSTFRLLVFSVLLAHIALAQKPIQNGDVLQMFKAGFAEDTIVMAIEANQTAFDVSVADLVALKDAGVPEKVIAAMLDAEARHRKMPSSSDQPAAASTLHNTTQPAARDRSPKQSPYPSIYVEEVSSEGSVVAASDTTLEAIKTLTKKGMPVVTERQKADYILQVTRQLGKKSWRKDTKVALSDRAGNIVYANSTRSVGGAIGDVVAYIRKHHE